MATQALPWISPTILTWVNVVPLRFPGVETGSGDWSARLPRLFAESHVDYAAATYLDVEDPVRADIVRHAEGLGLLDRFA